MIYLIKELRDIRIQYPVHLLALQRDRQHIQRVVMATPHRNHTPPECPNSKMLGQYNLYNSGNFKLLAYSVAPLKEKDFYLLSNLMNSCSPLSIELRNPETPKAIKGKINGNITVYLNAPKIVLKRYNLLENKPRVESS